MNISIFGMGYVGAVCAACLSKEGHTVVGVDPNSVKVDMINAGGAPIIEKDLAEFTAESIEKGLLSATTNAAEAVKNTDISMVCVGTPSQINGSLDLSYVRRVCEEIGTVLKEKDGFHIVVMRSTVLPGTVRGVMIPTLEEYSGKKAGVDFGVGSNPEFLREGTAIFDFYNPPKTVIGESDTKTGDALQSLYDKLDAPLLRLDIETAEMVKYADNAWHAVKVCFGNEIGNICKAVGVDGHKVMDVFCQDKKLNLSPYYLKPGFAFGGSCLPKDVRAITYRASSLDLEVPLLGSLLNSNNYQIERALKMVTEKPGKKIGLLGLSFKAGTDDLRESPIVELVERLIGKGYDLKIFDSNVSLASLIGANKDYIHNHIPHISKLLVESLDEVVAHADTVIIGNGDPQFKTIFDSLGEQQVVDLVRASDETSHDNYDGICW